MGDYLNTLVWYGITNCVKGQAIVRSKYLMILQKNGLYIDEQSYGYHV